VVETGFRVGDDGYVPRERPARGRGGDRPRGGRGGDARGPRSDFRGGDARGPRSDFRANGAGAGRSEFSPKIDDEAAFPSLG
jgi:hypothetical protein